MEADERLIRETLRLAAKGRYTVSPNPMVGAIIAKDGIVIARGYHRRFGGAHAEVEAITSAAGSLTGSTLYVNLEPCNHVGKQPPCAPRIVEAGITRVVIGASDPNPLVNGGGIRLLRERGVEVEVGVLEATCRRFNAAFYKHMSLGLPLVTLKIAQTLDGRIAAPNGESKWITGPEARKTTHKMRAANDAIVAGIGTVLSDDPQLNVRDFRGPSPLRVILDSDLRMPLEARLLNDELVAKTVIATAASPEHEHVARIRDMGAEVMFVPRHEGGIDLAALCRRLAAKGVASVLVEGGSRLFSGFLRAGLVDRLAVFVAPLLFGGGLPGIQELGVESLLDGKRLQDLRARRIGSDILITAEVVND